MLNLNLTNGYETDGIPSFDAPLLEIGSVNEVTASEVPNMELSSTLQSSLKMSGVKSIWCKIVATDKGYKVTVTSNEMAKKAISIIASQNPEAIITYSDDLDVRAEKLIKKTKKPLWVVSAENGVVTLERNF